MEIGNILSELVPTLPPCPENGTQATGELCAEQEHENEWLENEVVGMRLWQLVGIVLSILLAIVIMICCCVRFRIPRTKQEIEADYIRKKLTKSFRRELAKISDKEMQEDDMDLKKALERIQEFFNAAEIQENQEEIICEGPAKSFGSKFNAMFQGMRVRFQKNETPEFNTMI
ncbi:transmembrane inner ear expressed protein [Trichogramma pretiosum]|uniref:transmembrane inner ear expressed protein n=1 Tax=Trichogramma pretiosum TaxID=7493 RepID=UPI0006C98175|nr:transmembrane inner ear expressed protein [Trichogramma pretiosum]